MHAIKIFRKLGQNVVASRIVRHMATADDSKLYELRIYQMKPERFRESVELLTKYWSVRTTHSKAVGSWMTEIGGICETVHIWEYDSMSDRFARRQKVAEDQVWQKEFLPKFFACSLQLSNSLLALQPGTDIKTDFTPSKGGAYYELQSCGPYSPPVTRDQLSTVVAQFTTIYGPTPVEYILLRYTDPDEAYSRAYERRNVQGLKGYSRFMVPSTWSPLQ